MTKWKNVQKKNLKVAILFLFGILFLNLICFVSAFDGLGNGTIGNPYQITNCSLLQSMNKSLTSHYIIMNNIDCLDTINWNGGLGFEPVKMAGIFSGSLDGQNYNITNLFINGTGLRVGLISDLNGNISNVNLVSVNIKGNDNVGSLVGYHRGGIIRNCNIYGGSVLGLLDSGNVGGFVGRTTGATSLIINSSVNNINVRNDIASSINTGGFVGLTGGSANITNCRANFVNVTANGTNALQIGGFCGRAEAPIFKSYASNINVIGGSGGYVGGFVGYIATSSASITNSWTSGNVVSSGIYSGGFAGRLVAPIINCYSTANITSSADYVGGFIGFSSVSYIFNSYSIGKVTHNSPTYRGGFCGRNSGGNITNCYYDNQTSGMTDTGRGVGLTTVLMKQKSSFVDWDFITPIWYITENITYPSLIPSYFNPPIVIFPLTNYYNQNMNINYTSASSGYPISYYNISLVNADLSHNQTITLNNSLNLSYIYNTTNAVDGYYYVKVTACDINQDCGSSYSEIIVIDNTAPFGSLNSPLNNTFTNETLQNFSITVTDNYNLSNLTLFIYNSSNDLINQTLIQTNLTSGTFSIVYDFLTIGIYHWFYQVLDEVGNLFQTMIYTLNIIPSYLSVTITSPINNTNYSYSITSMTYISSGMTSCWYSLNQGQTNVSVVCNNPIVNITSQNGINIWRVYANNSIGNETYDETIFNSTCINPDVSFIVPTYPYVDFNTTYTIKLSPFVLGNSNIKLEILNDNSIYNFIYNNTTQEYELSFIFTNETDYNFVIYGDGICPTVSTNITGTFKVRKPFYVIFRGFISKENATWFHTNKYINNFAYITAELTGIRTMFSNNYNNNLEPFFAPSRDSRFSKPVWYSSYSDGEATIKLYEQGEYAIRLIDGQITFSGDYAIPNVTESYGVNVYLGKYTLTNSSSYNILFQEKDLRPFTWLFNWVYIILLVLIILVGAILFFAMPDNVAFSSVFVIGGIIALTLLRIILWVVGY